MTASIRVNLHCHSNLSDGQLAPEVLAERLARSGVRVAALTDHDTVEGQARFRKALALQGVGWIAGLELSTQTREGSAHLLAYGFDPDSAQLSVFRNGQFEPYTTEISELPQAASSIEWYRGWRDHLAFAQIGGEAEPTSR